MGSEVDAVQFRWCVDCDGETVFEVPPCEDGHGADCLDLVCVECGAALVLGVLAVEAPADLEVRAA